MPFNTDTLLATAGFQSQSADLVSGRPSAPAISILVPENDSLILEAYEIPPSDIPTSASADFMQTTG